MIEILEIIKLIFLSLTCDGLHDEKTELEFPCFLLNFYQLVRIYILLFRNLETIFFI